MGAKFSSELTNRDGVITLKLAGVVDEDNELASLESKLGSGPVVLDLAEIDRINSCGVRDWVNWLGRIEKLGARVVFVNCSPAIVAQINLVHNFTAGGIVKSFYAPYFCPRCEKEKLLRLETRDLVQNAPITTAPTCRCDECDGPMDFDDMEESYFAFLNNTKKVLGDPSFENTMREIAAVSEGGGRMRLRNSGIISSGVGGTNPSTNPIGSNPGTPSLPTPSTLSPAHRTPTPTHRTNPGPGSTTGRTSSITNPGGNPAAFTSTTSPQPSRPDNLATTQPLPPATHISGPQEQPAGIRPSKPPTKNALPWVMLVMFLLAAAALLAVVVLKK